jgi:hypothetical protein
MALISSAIQMQLPIVMGAVENKTLLNHQPLKLLILHQLKIKDLKKVGKDFTLKDLSHPK